MEDVQLIEYLRKFTNKAIMNGGFTAEDGRNIANVVDAIEAKLKLTAQEKTNKE